MFYNDSLDNLIFLSVQNHNIKYFNEVKMFNLDFLAFL